MLGRMPEAGIRSLPRDAVHGIPRAEVYLVTDDAAACHARALAAGATELSALARRSGGDDVAHSLDLDGHVVTFAHRA